MKNTLNISSHIINQRGIGLVEVMVALMLLAVAVLGFSAMQMTAVKATDESVARTRALTVIRGGAEAMRANPSGITAFKEAVSATKGTETSVNNNYTKKSDGSAASIDINSCMGNGTTNGCTINQLATRDGIALTTHAKQNNMNIAMVACPGTTGKQERQCIVTSWGKTKAILDNDDSEACANSNGTYKMGAQCFIMEAY